MINSILKHITESKERGEKLLAILLDPDKVNIENIATLTEKINRKIDFTTGATL